MIAGAYSLHLYCDRGTCADGFGEVWFLKIDHLDSRAAALREAKKRGWIVNWEAGEAICPKCAPVKP